MNNLMKKHAVINCKTLEEFLTFYRKPERFTLLGKDYVKILVDDHKEDIKKYGCTWIGKHESCTGTLVSFYKT